MRHRPIQTAPRERVPFALWGPSTARRLLATVAASAVGLVPAIVCTTPAQAAPIANLTISAASNWEGGRLAFTVTYTGATASNAITFSTEGNAEDGTLTAVKATDFTADPSVLTHTFPGTGSPTNVNTLTVYVDTVADADITDAASETLNLVATDALDSTRGLGTIWDWDNTNKYTFTGPGTVAETATTVGTGASAVTTQATARVSATLDSPVGQDVVLPVATTDGTAVSNLTPTADNDFTALPETAKITIPAGQTSGSVVVTLNDDKIDEDEQTFTVGAVLPYSPGGTYGPSGVAQAGGQVAVNIGDDDAQPTVKIANAGTVTEGSSLGFPVTLSNPTERTASVTFDTASGENTDSSTAATSGTDFTAVTNRVLTFPNRSISTTVLVNTIGPDSTIEGPENLKATLSAASNLDIAPPPTATGLITDTDTAPSVAYRIGGTEPLPLPAGQPADVVSIAEGQTGDKTETFIYLRLSAASTIPVKLDYKFSGTATKGTDYIGTDSSVTIPAGQSVGKIPVTILGDNLYEKPDETIVLTVTSPNNSVATSALGEKTFTITDVVDAQPTFTVSDVTVDEGSTGTVMAKVPVTLSAPTNEDVTFTATINTTSITAAADDNGTLVGDNDYDTPTTMTTVVKAGTTSATFDVPVRGDLVYEKDEQFNVVLATSSANVNNTALGSATGRVTIRNDDAAPRLTFNESSGSEGTAVRIIPTAVGQSQADYTVKFTVGSADVNGATPIDDFDVPTLVNVTVPRGFTGALTVPPLPGGTPTSFPSLVYLAPDNIDEPTEGFTVTASEATPTPIGFATSVGTYKINDDPGDLPPSAAIRDESIKENEGSVDVRVDLTPNGEATSTTQTITIPYWTVDNTAKAGEDYESTKGVLSIPPGTTQAKINVEILNDKWKEADETFYVKLGTPGPMGATVTKATGEVTIYSDDTQSPTTPTIAVSGPAKGAGNAVITGTVDPNSDVELWGAPTGGGALKWLAGVKADASGNYRFTRAISTGYRFAVQSQTMNSVERAVRVTQNPAFSVSSTRGKITLKVTGNPKAAGQTVIVQRWSGGKWVNTAWKGTTNAAGFTKTYSAKSRSKWTLRAFVAGNTPTGLNPGYSAQKTITIK